MYVYRVVVGVDLYNELLRKWGEREWGRQVWGGVFKPFKELDINNLFNVFCLDDWKTVGFYCHLIFIVKWIIYYCYCVEKDVFMTITGPGRKLTLSNTWSCRIKFPATRRRHFKASWTIWTGENITLVDFKLDLLVSLWTLVFC